MDANLDMKGLRTLKRPNIAAGSVKSKLNFLNLIYKVKDILIEVIQMVPNETFLTAIYYSSNMTP